MLVSSALLLLSTHSRWKVAGSPPCAPLLTPHDLGCCTPPDARPRYTAAKRFGLEGAESLIPGMKALIDSAADLGVENVVIGMPHRGRLNVLANVVRKPMSQIFSEFSGAPVPVSEAGGQEWLHLLCPCITCGRQEIH